MYQNILVGLDGSEHGLRAMEAACELAGKFDAVLHVLTVTRAAKKSPQVRRFMEAENMIGEGFAVDEEMQEAISKARDVASDAGLSDIKTVQREGDPAAVMVKYAKNNKVDLIVIGSRGTGGIGAFLLGNVSYKVSKTSTCACLIVK